MNRFFYALHRWISAAAFIQLAIWTTTGFLFTWLSQEAMKSTPVEGAHRGVITSAPPATVAAAIAAATDVGEIERVELRGTAIGPFYVVTGSKGSARVDARTGALAPVTQQEAEAAARRDQPGSPPIRETKLVTESPHIEYRDGPLPVWRVVLENGHDTAIYVDAVTGEVTQRHNERARFYDILWMLHVMDYKGRENFNHPLIRCAATLALITAYTGIVILGMRVWRWIRVRMRARAPAPAKAAVLSPE